MSKHARLLSGDGTGRPGSAVRSFLQGIGCWRYGRKIQQRIHTGVFWGRRDGGHDDPADLKLLVRVLRELREAGRERRWPPPREWMSARSPITRPAARCRPAGPGAAGRRRGPPDVLRGYLPPADPDHGPRRRGSVRARAPTTWNRTRWSSAAPSPAPAARLSRRSSQARHGGPAAVGAHRPPLAGRPDRGRRSLERLKPRSAEERRFLVESCREFQVQALAERLRHESEKEEAARALELARLARRVAEERSRGWPQPRRQSAGHLPRDTPPAGL